MVQKNKISRRDFLRGALAGAAGMAAAGMLNACTGETSSAATSPAETSSIAATTAAPSNPTAAPQTQPTDLYTPGKYSATEKMAYADITVTMEFTSSAITSCTIESSGAQDLLTEDLKTSMAAAIVEGQSADVDAVTGCSLSASVAAIQSCVAQCVA